MVDNHDTCKLLISSQDIPSIRIRLKATPSIFLGSQAEHVAKDIKLVVERRLEDIKDTFGLRNSEDLFDQLEKTILNRAEGMFLWVHVVLEILETSSSVKDLKQNIHTLPKSLKEA
ncbi:NACHT domain-containing protein [Colletotrichum kahawae]|uniref:NACHT domain-containing protein n=1 Tax=Colletotrichum kahawae TaxID=34407 RepID=A0AAD9Y9N8_COLKA|nr:NACHT domain-containing protein [Colletotrichum kahawae]